VDPMAVGEALTVDPRGGRGDGRQGAGGGRDGGQRGNDSASVEVIEQRAPVWRGNDSCQD
jgi:hypothetical protein